jgi:hypothetical protein
VKELPATWGRVVGVWWLITWRTVLGAMAIYVIIGSIVASVLYYTGEIKIMPLVMLPIYIVGWNAWNFVVIRMAVRKGYKKFHIALVAKNPN